MPESKSILGRSQQGVGFAVIWGIGMLVYGLISQKMHMVVSAAILIGISVAVYAVIWAVLRNRNSN